MGQFVHGPTPQAFIFYFLFFSFIIVFFSHPHVYVDIFHCLIVLFIIVINNVRVCVCVKAGLLGCEAVLSSMALMQASTISAPKKMMTPLAPPPVPGPTQRDPQGHMGLTAAMTCPPLVRRLNIMHYTNQGKGTVPVTTECYQ